MQVVTIQEAVKVRADFQGGQITPLRFKRGSRVHRVSRVNSRWVDRDRVRPRYCFTLTDASDDVYQLVLQAEDMIWMLEHVIVP
jgi:hypothetical protein